jgi:hypothetical protein
MDLLQLFMQVMPLVAQESVGLAPAGPGQRQRRSGGKLAAGFARFLTFAVFRHGAP